MSRGSRGSETKLQIGDTSEMIMCGEIVMLAF